MEKIRLGNHDRETTLLEIQVKNQATIQMLWDKLIQQDRRIEEYKSTRL